MTGINRTRWLMLEPLVNAALDLEDDDRAAFLASLAARDPASAADVRALLADLSDAAEHRFLATPLVTPPSPSLAGTELGGHRLIRPLGSGGMGSVWLAEPTSGATGAPVAIKLLKLALLTEVGRERFRREATALARLTHPGVGRLLDTGVGPADQPFLVLEYIDGQPIDEFVRSRQLSHTAILQLMQQVIEAVAHAHQHRLVHRDLKPSNILVTDAGDARLLDFGIAKLLDAAGVGHATLTAPREWLFTPDFAAPEQVRCEPVTAATDVYALGVLLYLLLSGRHPTSSGHGAPSDRVQQALTVTPPPLGLGDVDAIVHTALRKAAAERYPDARALGDELARLIPSARTH